MPHSPRPVTERELTSPVSLTRDVGRLEPAAVGWARSPLVDTDRVGRGPLAWGRTKRWEYWAVTTPRVVVALVVSDIDYAGVCGLWFWDRATGTVHAEDLITPLAAGVSLPGSLGDGPTTVRHRELEVTVTEVAEGTHLLVQGDRLRFDLTAHRPSHHECLAVVVPWTSRLFQYTVKEVARPASGRIWFDGIEHEVTGDDAWATLDHGRGRWPRRVHWNWGAGTGRIDGRVVGVQVGGRWTDGTGSTENAVVIDGRLHKISEELRWEYDTTHWLRPWRVTGADVDLTFVPEYDKVSATDLRVVSSATHQCFGTWSGSVTLGTGELVRVADVFGWAEDVHQKW